MRHATWLCRAGLLGVFAMVFATMAVSRADEPKPADDAQVARPRDVRPTVELIDDVGALPKYWLDMKLSGVPKALDEQLQLDGKGALVTQVGSDGPAAKAGVKVYDVVMAVGERPIEKLSDVVDEVNKSEGKEVSLKVLRVGKEMTLAITPAERFKSRNHDGSSTRTLQVPGVGGIDIDIENLEEKIREKLKDAGVDLRLQLIQPGQFVRRGEMLFKTPDFPDDLSITVTKTGKNPGRKARRIARGSARPRQSFPGPCPDAVCHRAARRDEV
jgi:membrane-associated protease RseP (regulator of RpoE activity)